MASGLTNQQSRVLSKGTSFWIREAGVGCTWGTAYKAAGVISISGPSLKRSGMVDGTELTPGDPGTAVVPIAAPVVPNDTIEESQFYTQQYPGTKKIDPVKLELNMSWDMYLALLGLFNFDIMFNAYVLFRNGNKLYFDPYCFIESIEMDIQENQFVKTPVEIQPAYRMLYIPAGVTLPTNCAGTPTGTASATTTGCC